MRCSDVHPLLDAALDGELASVAGDTTAAQVTEHLATCVSCQRLLAEQRAFADALGQRLPRYPASDTLRARMLATVRNSGSHSTPLARAAQSSRNAWKTVALAASLLLAVVGAHDILSHQAARSSPDMLNRELVASHVRSLMPGHLMDVASTDRHTVKPWFEGKLDFSPPVFDFASDSFPLVGGRLDYIAGRTAAALVFKSSQHTINLLVWPDETANPGSPSDAAGPTSPGQSDLVTGEWQGHHIASWRHGGLHFAAVSTVAAGTLRHFAELYEARDTSMSAPPASKPAP